MANNERDNDRQRERERKEEQKKEFNADFKNIATVYTLIPHHVVIMLHFTSLECILSGVICVFACSFGPIDQYSLNQKHLCTWTTCIFAFCKIIQTIIHLMVVWEKGLEHNCIIDTFSLVFFFAFYKWNPLPMSDYLLYWLNHCAKRLKCTKKGSLRLFFLCNLIMVDLFDMLFGSIYLSSVDECEINCLACEYIQVQKHVLNYITQPVREREHNIYEVYWFDCSWSG